MDFLPDRWSFSGKDFSQCPHLAFAKAYLGSRKKSNDKIAASKPAPKGASEEIGNKPINTSGELPGAGGISGGGVDYCTTEYFQLALQGRLPFPCHGSRDAHMRCQQFIYLINQIDQQGYRPGHYGAISLVHTVDGQFMVINGKHRLAALLALGHTHADVFLGFDNEIRAQFRKISKHVWPISAYQKSFDALDQLGQPNDANAESIAQLIAKIKSSKLETWADIYHPLPFYEFRHLSTQVQSQTPYQRLQMILKAASPVQGKRILDLGCNLGFYSFSLAKRGADVTAVELREDYQNISKQVSKLYNVPIQWKQTSLTPDLIDEVGKVDVTLCFSMIQWVIDQQGMAMGEEILHKISEQSHTLLFDVSVNEGKACLTAPRGEELWHVDQWLHKATTYPNIKCIGQVHPYGTDTRYVFCCSHGEIL